MALHFLTVADAVVWFLLSGPPLQGPQLTQFWRFHSWLQDCCSGSSSLVERSGQGEEPILVCLQGEEGIRKEDSLSAVIV